MMDSIEPTVHDQRVQRFAQFLCDDTSRGNAYGGLMWAEAGPDSDERSLAVTDALSILRYLDAEQEAKADAAAALLADDAS